MGKIGDREFLLPEFPKLYYAPSIWRSITWFINNYLSGPYPEDKISSDSDYFHWNKLKLPKTFNNSYCEGLAYFLIANFISFAFAISIEFFSLSNNEIYFFKTLFFILLLIISSDAFLAF